MQTRKKSRQLRTPEVAVKASVGFAAGGNVMPICRVPEGADLGVVDTMGGLVGIVDEPRPKQARRHHGRLALSCPRAGTRG